MNEGIKLSLAEPEPQYVKRYEVTLPIGDTFTLTLPYDFRIVDVQQRGAYDRLVFFATHGKETKDTSYVKAEFRWILLGEKLPWAPLNASQIHHIASLVRQHQYNAKPDPDPTLIFLVKTMPVG